ncbi:MAG: HEPN domain-containing protein [Clostridia bacterium]|nr:HEPN domain-containing protein [Clostridia bacterium]
MPSNDREAPQSILCAYDQRYTALYPQPVRLANLLSVYEELSESQRDFLDILEPLSVEARYPKEKDMILKSLTVEKCELLIIKTKELSEWIKSQL